MGSLSKVTAARSHLPRGVSTILASQECNREYVDPVQSSSLGATIDTTEPRGASSYADAH